MKIFIDTNIWISYFLSRSFGNLNSILARKEIKILTSLEQLDELERVLRYPKMKKYFSEDSIIDILKYISEQCVLVSIKRTIDDCRDSEDNYILDIGTQFHLDYIITGDEDLLTMHPFRKIKIIKIKKFLDLMNF